MHFRCDKIANSLKLIQFVASNRQNCNELDTASNNDVIVLLWDGALLPRISVNQRIGFSLNVAQPLKILLFDVNSIKKMIPP